VGAVIYRVGIAIRSRWMTVLVTSLVVAAVVALVLTIAAGANRTSTAPDRYASRFSGPYDALITQQAGGRPRTAEISGLPAVASAASYTFVFGVLNSPASGAPNNAYVFSGDPIALGAHLVKGRFADPDNEKEFVATQSFLDATNTTFGDTFTLVTLNQEQANSSGYGSKDWSGPRFDVRLVGVVDGPSRLEDPTPLAVVSPALLRRPDLGVALTMIAVELQPGADLAELRTQVDALGDSETLSLDRQTLVSDTIRRAVETQARGLWLLAAATAVAAIVALGQFVSRQVRPRQDERERLAALGFTATQTTASAFGAAVVPIVLGSVIGGALAVTASGIFPYGFARGIEPAPGLLVDWQVIGGGVLLVIIALAAWTLMSLALARSSRRAVRPSASLEALAGQVTPTAATGLRMAFGRRSGDRGATRSALVGVMVILAGLMAALTFGISLDRLIDQPFRYGVNFDLSYGDNGADALPDGVAAALDHDPDVNWLMLYAGSTARVADTTAPVIGFDAVRGNGTPYVIEGRLPVADDEIAFGRTTARQFSGHIGDAVTLAGPTGTRDFRVTGLVVMPGFWSSDGMGAGGLVTMRGLAALDAHAKPASATMGLRVSATDFIAAHPDLFGTDGPPPLYVPPAIHNVGRVSQIPYLLAGVLALLGLLTLGHVMLMSTRGNRRDLAILRSLGANARWIGRAVHWQATLFTLLCMAVAVPLGLMIGRLVFAAFADNMGVVDDSTVPVAITGGAVLVTAVLANVIAAIPARRARHAEPAALMHRE
jgi:putative ABC transport system permease protein